MNKVVGKEGKNKHLCAPLLQHRGPEKPASYHSKIDADIDSLTSMLADLDSHPQDSSTQVGNILLPFPHDLNKSPLFIYSLLLAAVRQRALQQIPLRGSLQAGAAASGSIPPPPSDPVPPGAPVPQRAPGAPVPHLLPPPAGLLLVLLVLLLVRLGPQAVPAARPGLLHHGVHPHRAALQRPGQDGAARHLLPERPAGRAGLHAAAAPPARRPPASPEPESGLVPVTPSSGDAPGGGVQGWWRRGRPRGQGRPGPHVQERDGEQPRRLRSAESGLSVQQGDSRNHTQGGRKLCFHPLTSIKMWF